MSTNEKKAEEARGGDRAPRSMVAPKPATAPVELLPLDRLAVEHMVPAHALAGMCRHFGWAEGKQLSATEFSAAVAAYRVRPMGSGRRE